MHTVIITDPYTTSLFVNHRYLFAPYLYEHGGTMCHCIWQKGDNIDKAVPDLYDSIKGHPEWRAIILVHPSQKNLFDPNNPFDFKCNHKIVSQEEADSSDAEDAAETAVNDEGNYFLKDNPEPLVCLTYMLAGFPPLGVKGYETGYVYYDEKTGTYKDCMYDNKPVLKSIVEKNIKENINKRIAEEYPELERKDINKDDLEKISKEEIKKLRDKYFKKSQGVLIPKMVEVPFSNEEKEIYNAIAEKYAFKENRPVEVLILSIREQYASDDVEETKEMIRRVWQFHNENESSDFWKVYPNSCRFLCYDLINKEHTLYSRELWKFFLLTLTLAVNQIPGRSLQAYFLYNVNLKINTEELGRVYDKYMENLMSFKEIIQERLSHVPEITQDKRKELVPDQYVSVDFDQIEEDEVKAKSNKIGLAADCPVSEAQFWHEHIKGTRNTIENILSAPQEIVAEKAAETRIKINSFTGREQVLDRFQIDRLKKRIDGLETKIFNTNLFNMLNTDNYKAEVAKAGNTVRDFIKLRLSKRGILLISMVSLLVFLFGFIPYIVNYSRQELKIFGAAFGLLIAVSILLAVGAMLTLFYLRGKLVDKIKTYNRDVSNIFGRIKDSAHVFSEYFSDLCTYMYARSLQSGIILKKDNDNTAKGKQKAHLNYLESEIQRINSICSLYGAPLNDYSGRCSIANINEELFNEWPSNCRFYELETFMEKDTVKITTSPIKHKTKNISADNNENNWDQYNTGITLNAPYSFISGLNLVREEIYDHKEEA